MARKLTAKTAIDSLRGTLALPRGRAWLVIGPSTWGKAFSVQQAWENAERPAMFLLFDAPPCAYVDDMGGICWYPHLYADGDVTQGGKYPQAHSISYAAKRVRLFKDGQLTAGEE